MDQQDVQGENVRGDPFTYHEVTSNEGHEGTSACSRPTSRGSEVSHIIEVGVELGFVEGLNSKIVILQ